MASPLLISLVCPDRVGLLAAVTGALYEIGADLGDTSFAVLGAGAEFTALATLPEGVDAAAVERALRAMPELGAEAELRVRPFGLAPGHQPEADATHRVELVGQDRPGLLARITEVFLQFDANIVRLSSERLPDPDGERYLIRVAARIPPARVEACLAALGNTASEMRLAFEAAPL